MTQTMSAPNEWIQFYNQNLTPSSHPNPPLDMPTGSTNLSPEGRVAKSTRRRSRASRRTPTTLLNTDTTNFRAMVQQFTGGPTAPFPPTPSSPSSQVLPNLMGFPFPSSRHVPSLTPNTLLMPTYLQHQQHMFQHQYNLYSGGAGGDHDNTNNLFFQRLANNPMNPTTNNVVGSNSNSNSDVAVNMDHGRFFPSTSS